LDLIKGEAKVNLSKSDLSKEKTIVKINYYNSSLFDVFIYKMFNYFKEKEFTKVEIKEKFELSSKQIDEWLKTGVEKKLIIKKSRPVIYKLIQNFKIVIET